MRRLLAILGIVFLAAAFAWPWLSKLPLGRLPGDIVISRPGFKFYFPIVTCIIVGLIVSLLIRLLRR